MIVASRARVRRRDVPKPYPVQVIKEKIVEVPVEVQVIKEKIVEVPTIRPEPYEVRVEVPVEVVKDTTHTQCVPVPKEVVKEIEVVKEVPVEVVHEQVVALPVLKVVEIGSQPPPGKPTIIKGSYRPASPKMLVCHVPPPGYNLPEGVRLATFKRPYAG